MNSAMEERPDDDCIFISPRQKVRLEHAEWSQSAFGDVGPVGPLMHLSQEALEAAGAVHDLSEWADMQFLLWDAQRRAGITDDQITQAMIEKLAINKARTWHFTEDGKAVLHVAEDTEAYVEKCPICASVFRDDDVCASEITMGPCHAACLDGSPIVDLETGDETGGKLTTYKWREISQPGAKAGGE
ncbi:DUF550 domain-containing protein [Agrobacterium vitis]|uniref:dATP/dGTP pyrophosphohydrolase domain-containing protein n=1 Tax=Agrobacterium vitis TaxID=373 RepID=UPI0009BD4A66|nr:dATP/dGTP pyrophosphohydrolase domain-containing protein [Agrobacterium vitis]MUO96624.1 DUF550 domain-containing protein [Agrobacterium vitis]MVA93155.1 DUF550 domain-containing protein [Agrobacterium vitis]MVB03998.1 DUF550 domain-containing protein [Agrobacterium vitis]NSY12413.1 DUF550 domain-containing protein [Agrobacterium vitis]NSY22242.1 DUF550 domain-containing protein [Agrobacterium vitis]